MALQLSTLILRITSFYKTQDINYHLCLLQWLGAKEQFIMKLVNSMDKFQVKEAHANVCRLVGDLLFALQDESSSSSQDRSIDSEPFLLALKRYAQIKFQKQRKMHVSRLKL